MKTRIAILGIALVLIGCSTLEVRKVNTLTLPENQERDGVGIRYFLTKPVWKITEKTAKDGVTEVGGCKVTSIIEFVLEPAYIPDPDHFYEVRLSPGPFSSDTFTVDLKEHGSLAKVFTKSEPQVTEAVKAAASIAKAFFAPAVKFVKPRPPEARPPECPPSGPPDPELDRLKRVEERLKKMLGVSLLNDSPTKQDVEAIKLLQEQFTATRIAIRTRQETAQAWLEGTTVTKVSYQEPDAWLWDKTRFNTPDWFPNDEQILDEFDRRGKTQRVFIYVKPAVHFRK